MGSKILNEERTQGFPFQTLPTVPGNDREKGGAGLKGTINRYFLGGIYMVGRIYHVGLTVSDLDRSIAFYRDILGLEFQGEIFMKGEETDKMFRRAKLQSKELHI